MAIDQIRPSKLNKDKHPLDLIEGEISDALNTTISDYGGSNQGLYKLVKGNTPIYLSVGDIPTDIAQRVVGTVADYQRGHVYFFVKSDTVSNNAIYRYSAADNNFSTVIKGSFLPMGDFVKANLVNIVNKFQAERSESLEEQCILFFTDGVYEPRRINVDRALRGEFASYDTENMNFMLSACKAAPNSVPKVTFETDSDYKANNFARNMFQFAVQYLYKDGDESAISGYSTIAATDYVYLEGIDTSLLPVPKVDKYSNNVCVIDISRFSAEGPTVSANAVVPVINLKEINKVRILGRNGNAGAFFVIDEVYMDEDKFRNLPGSSTNESKKVFDSVLKKYKFYNDGLYEYFSDLEVQKLYDNVPFTAVGQCIADDRVMYSNYTETYENVDVVGSITPVYSDEDVSSGTTIFSPITNTQNVVTVLNGPQLSINMLAAQGGFSPGGDSAVVKAGSKYRLSFILNPQGTFYSSSSSNTPLSLSITDQNGQQFRAKIDDTTAANPDLTNGWNSVSRNVDIELYVEEDTTVVGLTSLLASKISSTEVVYKSILGLQDFYWTVFSSSSQLYQNGVSIQIEGNKVGLEYTWGFDIVISSTNITAQPRLRNVELKNFSSPNAGNTYYVYTNQYQNSTEVSVDSQSFNAEFVNYTGVTLNSVSTQQQPLISTYQTSVRALRTFKAGSSHELGVVYYDKYNRSGYVNVFGSTYVEPFGNSKREGKNGPCSFRVSISSPPPSWAERFQIVYSGPSTIGGFTTYTTGGAYPKRIKENNAYVVDEKAKLLYVSLNTLEKFMSERGVNKTYSYTPGDKLRVISYNGRLSFSNADTMVFPTSTQIQGLFSGRVIEFDVVGFEVLGSEISNNPIADSTTVDPKYTGDFVIISAPDIDAGMYKYVGWDWYSVSNVLYPNGDDPTQLSYWGRESVVEIFSPAKNTDQKVYYEIGRSYPFIKDKSNSNIIHPVVIVSEGSCHFRPSMCKTPVFGASDADAWTAVGSPSRWSYKLKYIESSSANDLFSSSSWSRGRPQARYEKARTVREKNGIIYSDKYNYDSERLTLSSFNPASANFSSTKIEYGALNYIESLGENLIAIQENKTSMAGLSRNIVSYADGSESLAVSGDVIGQFRYLSGDYGCGNKPSSVLKLNNNVFYVDPDKRKIIRFSTDQAYIISDAGMTSFFDSNIRPTYNFVSGYDPEEDLYLITIKKGGNSFETVGYDIGSSSWISRYSFNPDHYNYIDNRLLSFKYTLFTESNQAKKTLAWLHNEAAYTSRSYFYAAPYAAHVEVVSNVAPSNVKVYNSMSILGNGYMPQDYSNDRMITITTDLNSEANFIMPTQKLEGKWYYKVKTSRKSAVVDSLSNQPKLYYGTGMLDYITNPSNSNMIALPSPISEEPLENNTYKITFSESIKRKQIKIGDYIFRRSSGSYFPVSHPTYEIERSKVLFVDENYVIVDSNSVVTSNQMFCVSNYDQEGDSVRGHYAKAIIYMKSGFSSEIHSVNFHISDSKDHHVQSQE